ncbi:MAG: AAA family ATPase [Proteobacteria bacterium]|nr:AAA family ATPase [Pseudomonadota bacterium]
MAIYHLSSGFISRSSGRSAVQNTAYITGEKLHESRRGIDVNYQNRSHDVACFATLLPEHAPSHLASLSIWDKAESFEDEYALKRFPNGELAREKYMNSAQTAMTLIAALPKELSLDSSKELIEDFLKERFVSRGLFCTYAIHENAGNPHAHFLISRRSIDEKGAFSWLKDREICLKKELKITRSLWADKTNFYLERDGFDERISEKSFLDLGLNLKPTKHHGWYADKLVVEGKSSRIISQNEQVYLDNKQKIEITPTVILDEITSKQATFSQKDLLYAIQKRVGDDVNLTSYVFENCLKESIYVGEHIDGLRRYSSVNYAKSEEQALSLLKDFNQASFKQKIYGSDIAKTLAKQYSYLSDEQKHAVFGLLKDDALSVLVGRAGAGKTTTLKAVSDCYQKAGFNVIGCSLSAVASENLGNEAEIGSSTLHSLLYKLDVLKEADNKLLSFDSVVEEGVLKQFSWYKNLVLFGNNRLNNKTVIIVDEAGMIGIKQWESLLTHAKEAGSKIIAVGDNNQFSAVNAGDFFRAIKESRKENLFELSQIRRQKVDWMKQASLAFSRLDIQEGLTAYHRNGYVHEVDQKNIATNMARDYIHHIKLGKDVAVLAYTNAETGLLNNEIRSLLKQESLIEKETILTFKNKTYVKGEKIVFLENDKEDVKITNKYGLKVEGAFIKNGSVGTLLKADHKGNVKVQLKDQTFAHFNVNDYQSIDYGYAITTHKSQGQTVDITLVKAHKRHDAKALYVAMTRHREESHLYYSPNQFKSFNHLKIALSRYQDKDLVKDYTIQKPYEKAWERVQDYKLCGLDLAHMKASKDDFDIKAYQAIRLEQITLGREILKDFESHKTFINQGGFTKEMLEITTGLKQRPLSILEEKAKLQVELYGETALATRILWKELKGKDLNLHKSQFDAFKTMQGERNSLAKDILENYRLHAPFIKEKAKEYLISKKTLIKHVEKQNSSTVDNTQNVKEHHHEVTKSYTKTIPEFTRTSHEIVIDLNNNIKDIATHFLGKPTSQTSREWRYGKKGSIAIHVAGQKQGLYANFETGESGNVVKFIADQMNLDKKEAFKWGVDYLGLGSKEFKKPVYESKEKTQPIHLEEKQWVPTFPINIPYPDLKREKQLSYMLKGRHEVATFEYKDAEGKTLGYVVRLEDKDGNKITPTLTYCQNNKGQKQWQFKGFGDDRPLYGLDILKQKQNAPVLIVEGEKTCEAARLIFKDHAVITWSGGCGSVQKSDWSPLKDRDVTIWPDHDKAGSLAATKIAAILNEKDIKSLAIVDLPSTLPHKWDLADKLPQGFTHEELMSNAIKIDQKELVKDKGNVVQKELTITLSPLREITDKEINDTHQKFELYKFDLYGFKSSFSLHQKEMTNHMYQNLRTSFALVQKEEPPHLREEAVIQSTFYDTAKNYYNIKEDSPLDTLKSLNDIAFYATQKFMGNPSYYMSHDKSILIQDAHKMMGQQNQENTKAVHALQQKNPEVPQNIHQAYVEMFVQIKLLTNTQMNDTTKTQLLEEIKNIHHYIENHPKISKMDDRHKEVLLKNTLISRMENSNLNTEKSIFKAVEETVKLQKQIEQSKTFERQKELERGFER